MLVVVVQYDLLSTRA